MVLLDVWTSQVWLGIYKRTLFENVVFPEGRYYEDLAIGHLLYYGCSTDVIIYNKPYYVYNCNNDNSICSQSNNIAKKNFDIFLAFKERYLFSVDYEPGLSSELLRKTILHALGAYNAGAYYKKSEIRGETIVFLNNHKDASLKDNKISRINYAQLFLFYHFRYLYDIIIRFVYYVKGR